MEKYSGYCTTTYRMKLDNKHLDRMKMTKEIYNQIILFYYQILIQNKEWLELSNQELLRKLELMTIGARNKKDMVQFPFPFGKVPLYLRRAAINGAIGSARGYLKNGGKPAEGFTASPVYYAGMYKNLTKNSIDLKLWDGVKWSWDTYSFKILGRTIPEGVICLSPTLTVSDSENIAMLHIPIKTSVLDTRTIGERLKQHERVCAVYFPNNDVMAVCVLFDEVQNEFAYHFIRGGKQLSSRRMAFEKKRRAEIQRIPLEEEAITKKYRNHIYNLNNNAAHKISREIINYCLENQIKIIVFPKYFASLHLNQKGYVESSDYDWIGRKIERYIKYKAYQNGIVAGSIKPYYIASQCAECGEPIKRYNEGKQPRRNYYGGKQFICPNGHQGNAALNAARNVGKNFYQIYLSNKNNLSKTNTINRNCIALLEIYNPIFTIYL